jgi:23S rRNA G2445 N2-methylase RlmL
MPRRLPLFATAARGTEDLLAEELAILRNEQERGDATAQHGVPPQDPQ